jgi:hypothetical protein
MITSDQLTDKFIRAKLRLLRRTIRIRGVDCLLIRSSNEAFSKVHGRSNIDLDGDNERDTETKKIRLVLSFNNMDPLGDKSSQSQTVWLPDRKMEVGDIIKYQNERYTFHFKVEELRYYGERDIIYEYELSPFRTTLNNDR